MNDNYISFLSEAKAHYHQKRAKMPFEEKFKIIIELQKIEREMINNNKNRKTKNKLRNIWQVDY